MKSALFYHENASKKPRPGRKKRKKRNAVIVVILSLLAAAITAGLILIFITPKFEVTEITVMRAESFFSDEEWWPVEEHDEDCPKGTGAIDYIIPLDADEADYSIAIINMTVTGRSILKGKTILFRIDNNDGLDSIIKRFVFAGVEYEFSCFSREESKDLQLVVYSKDKTEEEIAAAIKDTIIKIRYYDSFHSYSTVYTSCKKAKVTFEN